MMPILGIATEKSQGRTTVTVPIHPEFAESLRAARAAGIIGADVFTGKLVKDRVLPMNKKAWAAKFKKYAVLAGVNEPKKSCHGVRKARAEVAAYADCTESQMMAMFGWTDPKMPAHYIAQANREKLGMSGLDKIAVFDQSQDADDFSPLPVANKVAANGENRVVTLRSNLRKKAWRTQRQSWVSGALGGTRTPTILLTATSRQRVYQFRHERFCRIRRALRRTGSTARDVTNRGWRDKACQGGVFGLAGARQSGQHLLDF